jgi:type IX secretion system PorP/SprF family membrane protein
MKKLIIILFSFIYFGLSAQQIPYSSPIHEAQVYWNPATTAFGTKMSFDGFFRGQWLGFDGAPITGFASLQYPLLDYNMSAGGLLLFDKTGPISNMGIQLNYAYKLKMGRYSQLSAGLSGSFINFSINTDNELYNDKNDNTLSLANTSKFYPAIGAGIYYISNTREYQGNRFFLGLSYAQAFASDVSLDTISVERNNHMNAIIGTRLYAYDYFWEPSIMVNYVKPEIVDVIYSLKYEMENAFWTGISYSSVNDFAIQGGLIIDKFGNRYSQLKIGVLANIFLTESIGDFGPGAEFIISYQYDIE